MIVPPKPTLGQRSPHWDSVRRLHLFAHPTCAACGRKDELEVHHVVAFHLHPELELEPSNLITLCEGKRQCHFTHGHVYDWHKNNPNVRQDATVFLSRVQATEVPEMPETE